MYAAISLLPANFPMNAVSPGTDVVPNAFTVFVISSLQLFETTTTGAATVTSIARSTVLTSPKTTPTSQPRGPGKSGLQLSYAPTARPVAADHDDDGQEEEEKGSDRARKGK
jgi:hypothetical protein